MEPSEDEVSATISEAFQLPSVKPEQLQVVVSALKRQDVFAILTGFGKSVCFQCLPLLFDQFFPADDPSIVLVVTPLTSIMKDKTTSLAV